MSNEWSDLDTEKLRSLAAEGKLSAAISTELGRTPKAIRERAAKLAIQLGGGRFAYKREDAWQDQARQGTAKLLEAIQRAAA